MPSFGKEISSFVRSIYKTNDPVHLHEPYLDKADAEQVAGIVQSGMVSSVGAEVRHFENLIRQYVGVEEAICTVNGTSALHVALKVLGVIEGDLVLTQPLSFVATCNAIRYCGADPIFIDISKSTLSMCPVALSNWLDENSFLDDFGLCRHKSSMRVIRACLPVHTFGHPADIDAIIAVINKHNIPLIEDAAEALGSIYKGLHVGRAAKLSTLSFNGNKTITTGGGGCVLGGPDLIKKVKHLIGVAKTGNPVNYFHDSVGFNYRMPNLNAGLGLSQFEKLNGILTAKRKIAHKYAEFFHKFDVEFFNEPTNCKSNYWLNTIICKTPKQRDDLIYETHAEKVFTRPAWHLLSDLPPYSHSIKGNLKNANYLVPRLLNLPSGPPRT